MNPDISIIIPVIRETGTINPALEALSRQTFGGTAEVIVVDGDPYGSTLRQIRTGPVTGLISEPGRGIQLNAGAAKASGRILLFLHCDTRLPESGLQAVHDLMSDAFLSAGAFDLKIDKTGLPFRIIEKTASLRSRLTRIPYGDQAVFVRQSFFDRIGGFRPIPIMEDVELMRRVKQAGGRIGFVDRPVSTSARRWEKEGLLRCTLRNWLMMTLYLFGVSPERLVHLYRNHDEVKAGMRRQKDEGDA